MILTAMPPVISLPEKVQPNFFTFRPGRRSSLRRENCLGLHGSTIIQQTALERALASLGDLAPDQCCH